MKGGTGSLQAVREEGRFQSDISVMSLHCLTLDGTRITIKYACASSIPHNKHTALLSKIHYMEPQKAQFANCKAINVSL